MIFSEAALSTSLSFSLPVLGVGVLRDAGSLCCWLCALEGLFAMHAAGAK